MLFRVVRDLSVTNSLTFWKLGSYTFYISKYDCHVKQESLVPNIIYLPSV